MTRGGFRQGALHRARFSTRQVAALLAALSLSFLAAPGANAQEAEEELEDVSPGGDPVFFEDGSWADADYETRIYSEIMAELYPEEQERFRELYGQLYQEDRRALFTLVRSLPVGERGILVSAMLDRPTEASYAFLGFVNYLPEPRLDELIEIEVDELPRRWDALIDYTLQAPYGEVAWTLFVAHRQAGCPDPAYPATEFIYLEENADGTVVEHVTCSEAAATFLGEMYPPVEALIMAELVEPGEAPWQAQLVRSDAGLAVYETREMARRETERYGVTRPSWERRHICGGVFIGDRWVLTAAHCLEDYTAQDLHELMRVRLGSRFANTGAVQYRVTGAVVHNRYVGEDDLWQNDIALIRLGTEVDEQPGRIEVARVPRRANQDASLQRALDVTGWGVTGVTHDASALRDDDENLQRYSRGLLGAQMQLWRPSKCSSSGAMEGIEVNDGQVCAGSDEGVDPCRGDSGGPLVLKENGEAELIGLVSWGMGCGLPNTGKIFTDVGYYREWIAAAMRASQPWQIVSLPCRRNTPTVC